MCACVYRCVCMCVDTCVYICAYPSVWRSENNLRFVPQVLSTIFWDRQSLWPGAHLGGSADQSVSCRDLSACLCLPGPGILQAALLPHLAFYVGFGDSCLYSKHCQNVPSPQSTKPSLFPCVPALCCSMHWNNSIDWFTLCQRPMWLLPNGYNEIVGEAGITWASTQRKLKWPERLQSACFFPPHMNAFKSSAKREEQLLNWALHISLSQTF